MWKKLGVVFISLIATFSVVYAMNKDLSATGSYNAGGNVTGRINQAPTGISGSNIGMQKGDKILLGVSNPNSSAKYSKVVLQLINYETYSDYGCSSLTTSCNNEPLSGWFSLTYDSLGNVGNKLETSDFEYTTAPSWYTTYQVADYSKSTFSEIAKTLNDKLLESSDIDIFIENNLSGAHKSVTSAGDSNAMLVQQGSLKAYFSDPTTYGKGFITPLDGAFLYQHRDRAFTNEYWLETAFHQTGSGRQYQNMIMKANGTGYINAYGDSNYYNISLSTSSKKFDLRFLAYLNMENIVFSLSNGDETSVAKIISPSLPETYTYIVTDSSGEPMKLRVENADLTSSTSLTQLEGKNGSEATKIAKNSILYLNADAKAGSSADGVNTVSAIIFGSDGSFKYYKPLEPAKGAGKYELDMTGVPAGSYKIGIVNEVYNESSTAPADSSKITDVKSIEVVEPHTISYTATPQSQDTYEYTKNVDAGDKIGAITRSDGAVPVTYKLVGDGDNSYQNFEISGLDVNSASSATSLDVKVKASGAPDLVASTNSLKAGTYKFCIESTDANGDPITQVSGKSKVCATLSVAKTTPTISFTTATQKDMKIGDSKFSDTVTTSNKDTLSPGDITYALSGGISSVLDSTHDATNPLGYDLEAATTYSGTELPTTFTLTATLKETDNYISATTTVNRPIFVYKEISSLDWTASKGSYSSSDVVSGTKVGDLLVKDGVGPYKYELTTLANSGSDYNASDAANNGDFTIVNGASVASGTKVDVKTSKSLAIGTYKIQFKVTDSKGDLIYKSITINVSAKTQSAVDFKTGTGGAIITTLGLKIRFNDTASSLFAEGGNSSLPIEYYVASQADQTGSIDPSLYLEVNKTNGLLKPKKVGKIKVYALSPGDASYGEMKSNFMEVEIQPAEQTIAFNDATNPSKVEIGKELLQDAKGTIKKDGSTGIGEIKYTSSDTSVATVDASGKVTGLKAGNTTIKATLNDSSSDSYDANYETISCQKVVNVYDGMKLTWTAKSPNLKAESSTTGDVAGTVSTTGNDGDITFTIATNTGIAANADGALFQIVKKNTTADIQLKNKVTATSLKAHGNQYHIQVEAKDTNGTVTIDVTITIDDADNDVYFIEKGVKVTSLTKVFGENNNEFQLNTNTSNGGSVTYQVDPTDASGTLSVIGNGEVTINKVGTASVQAVVASGSGYAGGKVTMPITITPGNQVIAFKDTTTLNQKFVKDSTFNDPAELKETSANTVSTRTITYASTTPSICTIDDAGTITMLTKGICEVTATNNDANWQSTTTSKQINLYDGMGVSFGQSNIPQADSASAQIGSPVGSLTVSGGHGTKTYGVSTSSDPKNKDASFFTIDRTLATVSLSKPIKASDIATYYDTTKKAYIMHVQFETTDELGNKVTTDATVEIKGAKLNAEFDTGGVGKISKVYSLDGTFTVSLSSNAGSGTPTYQIKNDPAQPNDVLKEVKSNGLITIGNANDPKLNANPVMIEAIIPPSGGYEGETIEVEVEITKATQPDFGFKNTTINMSTESMMTLLYKGKLSDGAVTITNPSASDIISISGMDITTNKKTGTVNITIIDAGNRNYKMAKGTADVVVSDLPAYEFMISVPSATYGDTGLIAEVIGNELEEEHPGAIGVQTWSSSDPTIAEVDDDGNLTIHKAGSVEIKCTQTSDGGIPTVNSSATLVIKPKPITITINNKIKYVGEALPSFDMTIPSGVLVKDDAISLPIFSCVDATDTSVTANTPAGEYAITGTYPTGSNPNYNITVTPGKLTVKQDNSLPTWFHLEGVTSNTTLDSTKWHNQDVNVVLDSAVESAGTYNEISLDKTLWDANSITVNNEGENKKDVYFRIDASDLTHPLTMSSPQTTIVKIDKTKPVIKGITGTATNKDAISSLLSKLTFGAYFKPGTKVSIQSDDIQPATSARSSVSVSGVKSVAYEIFEIDRKTGLIGATAIAHGDLTPNASGISEVTMNDAGLYRVCAIPTDNAGNQGIVSCSDLNVKNIGVDVDKDGKPDNLDPDKDGCPDINIALKDKDNKFYKLNVDRDGDSVPDLNIDSDGDGEADINVDTDSDGKPDLNLLIITKDMWKPTFCVTGQSEEYCTVKKLTPTINIDTDDDRVPNINIDTDGDFKADFNITKEGETKPYLNIGKVHEAWIPDKNDGVSDKFLFDTDASGKPLYNIDSDGDYLPDINVDLDGDGKADINIDINDDGIPDLDIDGDGDGIPDFNLDDGTGNPGENKLILGEWKPSIKGEKDGTSFNTMEIKKKDVLEDGGIQVEKPGGTFLPNFAIKVKDVTNEVENEIKAAIGNVLSDKDVKNIYDVSLWKDNTQIQPDGTLRVKVPYDGSLKNPKVIIEMEDGTFKEVDAKIENGFLIYDSSYLGKIGIVDDKEVVEPSPDPTPKPDPTPPSDNKTPTVDTKNPDTNTSVKGTYVSGMGGAMTGDSSNITCWFFILVSSAFAGSILCTLYQKFSKK